MAFDNEQHSIAKSAIAALAVTIAMLVAAGFMPLFEPETIEQRLTIVAVAFASLSLALARDIGRLANHRFAEPLDRNAAAAETRTPHADMLSAILRNTHEQVTFAALVYAIAGIALPPHWTDAIMGCALLFLIGRLIFAAGYAKGAGGRAFGFGLTFYPGAALALLTAIAALV
ncbi:MAG TPA: MAPEG family protein [Sphingorhabdus sp.]|jgi:divalent metal cation (Fe/Co/Zn/Cd) transporter|nr:MAPEG family protein [Sphingorhabdus sp.]